ncbi:MAG: DUF3794 domain-containing protein [Clostridia bacterium]|nr:DUF3794 domain-containing protein [Clostridia bacterium]
MSVDYSYRDIEWCHALHYKNDDCLVDGNIIVPDSMDDIAKIVSVKGCPSVLERKCENGRINVTGQVKVSVLYIGENDSGKLFTLNTTQSFSHAISAPEVTDEYLPLVFATSCNISHTLINSRRLRTSANVKLCASSYKNNRTKVLSEVYGAEARSCEKSFVSARSVCAKNIIISDTLELNAGKNPITSILKHNVRISESDFKALNNKLIVKGNLSASILYCSDETLNDVTLTIPFTEVVEAEGVSPSSITNVSLNVTECEIRPETDLSGEYRMVDINVILSVCVTAFMKEEATVVTDMYLPHGALEIETAPIKLHVSAKEISEEEFFKESITLPPTAPLISRIVDTDCRISELNHSTSKAEGIAEVTFLYLSPSSAAINTYTARLPISHTFAIPNVSNVRCSVKHTGYAITGDSAIDIRISINFEAMSDESEDVYVISNCLEKDYTAPKRNSVTVSFVNKGDTLWSIAKKHNIALSSLASANAIDENAILTVGSKLIIPR